MNELVQRLSRIRDTCRSSDGTMIPLGLELQDAITAIVAADRMVERVTGDYDASEVAEALTAYRAATQKKD